MHSMSPHERGTEERGQAGLTVQPHLMAPARQAGNPGSEFFLPISRVLGRAGDPHLGVRDSIKNQSLAL